MQYSKTTRGFLTFLSIFSFQIIILFSILAFGAPGSPRPPIPLNEAVNDSKQILPQLDLDNRYRVQPNQITQDLAQPIPNLNKPNEQLQNPNPVLLEVGGKSVEKPEPDKHPVTTRLVREMKSSSDNQQPIGMQQNAIPLRSIGILKKGKDETVHIELPTFYQNRFRSMRVYNKLNVEIGTAYAENNGIYVLNIGYYNGPTETNVPINQTWYTNESCLGDAYIHTKKSDSKIIGLLTKTNNGYHIVDDICVENVKIKSLLDSDGKCQNFEQEDEILDKNECLHIIPIIEYNQLLDQLLKFPLKFEILPRHL